MVNKKIDEAVFDVLLEHAFADVIEEDVNKLQEENDPCTISAETDLKIRKMISKVGKRDHRMRTRTVIRVASIALVVLLNVGLIGLLLVPSVNAEVKNVFAELLDKYVSYEAASNYRKVVSTSEYEIGYIPDGFEVIIYEDDLVKFREINQGDAYISINISNEDIGRVSMDSENSETQTIRINGIDATLYFANDEHVLFWYDGYHFISIYTNIGDSNLIKIAKSIKKFD